MASKTELGVSQQNEFVSKSVLPRFNQLYREKLNGSHPIFSAVLPFPQSETEMNFNPWVRLNPYGQFEFWGRFEPKDPEAENSVVRKIEMKKGKFKVTDEIQMAQDPHVSYINENLLVLGAIRIDCTDPIKPGKVTNFREELFPIIDGKVDKSRSVICRPNEKDVRVVSLGNDKSFLVTRERMEKSIGENKYEIVDSYLQMKLLHSPQAITDIAKMVDIVREDSSSRVDLFQKEGKNLWIGPNFPFALISPDGFIHVGLFSHIGRYKKDMKCQNGEDYRQYVTVASEHVFSPSTGKIIRSERAKIVSTASDFEDFNIVPKKEGLDDVVFPGSPIFAVGDSSFPDYVILSTGVKDGASCISVIKYPFTLPPDPVLNKDYILPKDQAKKFLHSLEQPN